MHHELDLYSGNLASTALVTNLFLGMEHDIDAYVVPQCYVGKVSDLLPADKEIVCLVDHPKGLDDSKVRQHSTLASIKKGANIIDLCLNPILIDNEEFDYISRDIANHYGICRDYDTQLRITFDYRMHTPAILKSLLGMLQDINVEYIVPSTGTMLEDFLDNVIICKSIETDYNIKAISYPHVWLQDQYDTIYSSNIHGVRLRSVNVLKYISGV
jgi:deoxyribose-phosphate aldolase